MSYQHDGAVRRSEIENSAPDWSEVACRVLVAIGTGYFAAHFLIDGLRGLFS